MYVDSLHLRRTVPNCPQLTPAVALSVVPTALGYKGETSNLQLKIFIKFLKLKSDEGSKNKPKHVT